MSQFWVSNGGSVRYEAEQILPDDAEQADKDSINEIVEKYMTERYPSFDPEIIHAMDKDYYLPALKVLTRTRKGLFSPQQDAEWKGGELVAECQSTPSGFLSWGSVTVRITSSQLTDDGFEFTAEPVEIPPYSFPHEGCDCGIYGSVNLEEVLGYLKPSDSAFSPGRRKGRRVLCIIEPTPDTDVILSRKGWKAGAAFVSEIVGETISVEDAARLLSIAWHREIDIRSLFNENR